MAEQWSLSSIESEPCFSPVSSRLQANAVLMAGSVDSSRSCRGLPNLGSCHEAQEEGTGVFAALLFFTVQSRGCSKGCCEHQPCGRHGGASSVCWEKVCP